MTNKPRGVLYIGVTNDLSRRIYEHKQGFEESFTKKYSLKSLAYYEAYEDVRFAIQREKSLKRWVRNWKIELIEKFNPGWRDLYDDLI